MILEANCHLIHIVKTWCDLPTFVFFIALQQTKDSQMCNTATSLNTNLFNFLKTIRLKRITNLNLTSDDLQRRGPGKAGDKLHVPPPFQNATNTEDNSPDRDRVVSITSHSCWSLRCNVHRSSCSAGLEWPPPTTGSAWTSPALDSTCFSLTSSTLRSRCPPSWRSTSSSTSSDGGLASSGRCCCRGSASPQTSSSQKVLHQILLKLWWLVLLCSFRPQGHKILSFTQGKLWWFTP